MSAAIFFDELPSRAESSVGAHREKSRQPANTTQLL